MGKGSSSSVVSSNSCDAGNAALSELGRRCVNRSVSFGGYYANKLVVYWELQVVEVSSLDDDERASGVDLSRESKVD